MTKISGIFAASMSVINSDLSLNIEKTIDHAEKLINQGCHGTAIFGSTGQAQLIPISEKIKLLNKLSETKHKHKHLIGTGLNSLNETINFLKISTSLNLKNFLIMPPAYYKYDDKDAINFYTKIVESVPDSKIVLYNFEKLCGYKFSVESIEELVKRFPNNIVGVKDSSYNLFEKLRIDNFSIMPGSESKLLKGLELGCAGIITATCNVTAQLARRVYDDFFSNKDQIYNQKLKNVRTEFEKYNLISALHTFKSKEDKAYRNLLPPLDILNTKDENNLMQNLKKLNFQINSKLAA